MLNSVDGRDRRHLAWSRPHLSLGDDAEKAAHFDRPSSRKWSQPTFFLRSIFREPDLEKRVPSGFSFRIRYRALSAERFFVAGRGHLSRWKLG